MQDFCFHIHTARCGHADKSLTDETILQSFIEAGFKSIAFTDHNPWKTFLEPFNPGHAMEWSEKTEYLNSIRTLSKKYKDKIEVLTGFEMEYLPEYKDEMDELRADSDIIVSGQHFLFSKEVNGYERIHKHGFIPDSDEMDTYADLVIGCCKDGYADILAHPDLYMIYKDKFGKDEERIAHRICAAAELYKVPIEINMCLACKNRFFKTCDIAYPRAEFWKVATQYNVKTLYGLDYHGHFNPAKFSEMLDEVNKIIGDKTLEKLNFCTRQDIKTR